MATCWLFLFVGGDAHSSHKCHSFCIELCSFSCCCALQKHRFVSTLFSLSSQSFKEFLDNPPQDESDDTWMIKKTEQEEEDERILALLTAKDNAAAEAESHRTKEVELAGIAQEWGIREYAMRTRRGELDADTMTEQEFIAASREEAQAAAEETYARINSPEYAKAAARAQRASDEGNLFFPGMDDTERKRREMIVERVKKQYEDMLSDDEMEKILANEI